MLTPAQLALLRTIHQLRSGFEQGSEPWLACCLWYARVVDNRNVKPFVRIVWTPFDNRNVKEI